MREIALYARGMQIVDSDGNPVPIGARPVVRWREKVSFEVRFPNGLPITTGSFRFAFDYDRDFLDTEPCNSGTCTLDDGAVVFEVVFNSLRQAKATNGRMKPIPFFMQISKENDDFVEYIMLDAIWVDGCVWDGRIPPAPEAPNYYTKAEVDGIADGKLDKPAEPGETGYVLSLAEDGSTAWIPQSGGGGSTSWNDITDKPSFASVATTGSYNDLTDKPTIPAAQVQSDWNQSNTSAADFIKNKPVIPAAQVQADWNEADTNSKAYVQNKPNLSTVATTGSYNDLTDKPSIPPAQVQSDWTETNTGSKAFVKNKPTLATVATSGSYNDLSNKPTIPPAQVQANWNETSTSSKAYIQNKPTIPAAQIQADWDQTSTSALDYIKNKPTIPTATDAATNAQIDSRSASQDIRPSNLEYAVRSVLPNVTTILAATTAYTLYDASATTNSHSAHYTHAPNGIPTYTLPAVTNTTIAHEILLDVDFTNVQACGFLDSQGAEIPLQSDIAIAAGDKWRFICVYSLDGWRVYPLPIEVAGGGGGGASTLIVQGTTATTAGLAGTYEITNDTVNDHPVWFNSTNSKYLWLVENGMDAGWFGWVIGSTVAQQSAGDIPMFYEYFVADVTSPADTPVGLTWRTQMDELTAAQFTCVEG